MAGISSVYFESPETAHEWQKSWRRSPSTNFAPLLFSGLGIPRRGICPTPSLAMTVGTAPGLRRMRGQPLNEYNQILSQSVRKK